MLNDYISLSPDVDYIPDKAYCEIADSLIRELTICPLSDDEHYSHFCSKDCLHFCDKPYD